MMDDSKDAILTLAAFSKASSAFAEVTNCMWEG